MSKATATESNSNPDLYNFSDIELLQITADILLHPGPVSPKDQQALDAKPRISA